MNIYIAQTLLDFDKEDLQNIKKLYSKCVSDKIVNAQSITYQLRRVTSRLMLMQIFSHMNIPIKELKSVNYNKTGALVSPSYNLSFSYSQRVTACLVSEATAGFDIEYVKALPKPQHVKLLMALTGQTITNQLDFYRLWTRLESIAKSYQGNGLGDVIFGKVKSDNHLVTQYLFNNEYLMSVASLAEHQKVSKINYINIK